MIRSETQDASAGANHPSAWRMASIAIVSQNITIGCIMGSFSVLLSTVEQRLGVTREMSSLGIALITAGTALLAPVVGVLAARFSLRLLLILGVLLSLSGFLILAFTASFPFYLVAYGLLLGPGMCLAGVVLPSTLVTRWFMVNRGRALGLTHVPVAIVVVPVLTSWVLQHYGASATYLTLAAITGCVILPFALLAVDHPPGSIENTMAGPMAASAAEGSMTVLQLLRSPQLWALGCSAGVIITGAVILTAHLVPMAASWGIDGTLAASLLSIQSLVGIGGPLLFGWVADRLGGGRTLALLAFNLAIIWVLLLPPLPYAGKAILIGLIGLQSSAAMPVLAVAFSEYFGQATFSRAFGLATTMTLPFSIAGVQGAAAAFTESGSYVSTIIGMVVLFAATIPLAISAPNTRRRGT